MGSVQPALLLLTFQRLCLSAQSWKPTLCDVIRGWGDTYPLSVRFTLGLCSMRGGRFLHVPVLTCGRYDKTTVHEMNPHFVPDFKQGVTYAVSTKLKTFFDYQSFEEASFGDFFFNVPDFIFDIEPHFLFKLSFNKN